MWNLTLKPLAITQAPKPAMKFGQNDPELSEIDAEIRRLQQLKKAKESLTTETRSDQELRDEITRLQAILDYRAEQRKIQQQQAQALNSPRAEWQRLQQKLSQAPSPRVTAGLRQFTPAMGSSPVGFWKVRILDGKSYKSFGTFQGHLADIVANFRDYNAPLWLTRMNSFEDQPDRYVIAPPEPTSQGKPSQVPKVMITYPSGNWHEDLTEGEIKEILTRWLNSKPSKYGPVEFNSTLKAGRIHEQTLGIATKLIFHP